MESTKQKLRKLAATQKDTADGMEEFEQTGKKIERNEEIAKIKRKKKRRRPLKEGNRCIICIFGMVLNVRRN